MINRRRFSWSSGKRRGTPRVMACAVLVVLAAWPACQSTSGGYGSETRGIVIVNAPVAGEVRRVLVSEGAQVAEGAGIVEVAVRTETLNAPQQPAGEDPTARAGRNITAAQSGIEAARAEVVRAEVEVARLTPLVAAGQASPGELDGARAVYERAQQKLREAQTAAQGAQAGLVAARRQPGISQGPTAAATPSEQIVTARASSAGTVSAISARVGERVTQGQPLATLRAGER